MAYIGKSPTGTGVRQRYYFTATGGETSLSGADDNGLTLAFSDGNYVDVSLNGIALVAGTDYNTSTANTIGGLSALSASDIVEVVVYDIFTVADTVSAANGGTFSGAITANSGLNVGTIKEATGTNNGITISSSGLVSLPNSVYLTRFGLTSNLTADGTLTAWSAPTISNQVATIGSAVTVSSGLFTFPVTGVWRVHLNARVITTADGTLAAVVDITTDNGSNYTETAFASEGDGASTTNTGSIVLTEYVNVDDVSNVKVRFRGESIASGGYIQGQAVASGLRTWVSFERIADAQ